MSDHSHQDSTGTPESNPTPEEALQPELETPENAQSNTASESAESAETVQDPLEQALLEVAKWKDLALRNLAELENYRKRIARERQDDIAYANQRLIERLLPVVDNFAMGLEAARTEGENSMIFIGMNMIYKQMEEFLTENKVSEIPALNEIFDAKWHEAISQEPSDTVPEGTILRVLRKGYKMHDRILRAPNVVVSSGPVSQENQDDASASND